MESPVPTELQDRTEHPELPELPGTRELLVPQVLPELVERPDSLIRPCTTRVQLEPREPLEALDLSELSVTRERKVLLEMLA
jgi:hypothetical protein